MAREDSFLARRLKHNGTKFRFNETQEQNRIMMDARKKIAALDVSGKKAAAEGILSRLAGGPVEIVV